MLLSNHWWAELLLLANIVQDPGNITMDRDMSLPQGWASNTRQIWLCVLRLIMRTFDFFVCKKHTHLLCNYDYISFQHFPFWKYNCLWGTFIKMVNTQSSVSITNSLLIILFFFVKIGTSWLVLIRTLN